MSNCEHMSVYSPSVPHASAVGDVEPSVACMQWSSLLLTDNSFSISLLGVLRLVAYFDTLVVCSLAAEGPHLRTAQNVLACKQTPRDRQKRHSY